MKRKVALGGRPEREFSWSMSVEPGEWCLLKLKRHKRVSELLCDFAKWNAPEFVPDSSRARVVWNKLRVFSGQQRNARHGVVGNAALAKTRPADEPFLLLYKGAADKRNLIRRQKQWQ